MASAVKIENFGGPEVLQWQSVEVGDPGPGEIRIQQAASGLNYIDVYHRTGLYQQPLPLIPGVEGAGTVVAVGEGVEQWQVGDRIAYAGPMGSYSEQRLIDAASVVRLPEAISFQQAAAIMLKGMTAQMLLRQVYRVEAGETILVHAAAGGTGLILCQWAAALGATVIGTVSTEEKAEIARRHGCHHVVLYQREDFVDAVDRITDGRKLPVVYDSVGEQTFLKSLDCLQPRGTMVTFGQASGPVAPFSPLLLAQKGSLYLTRPVLFNYIAGPQALARAAGELFDAVSSGSIKVTVNQTFALREAAAAHAALESRATTGATVLLA